MKQALVVLWLIAGLSGCYMDVGGNGSSTDIDTGTPPTTDVSDNEQGELITGLAINKANTPNGDFPVVAKVKMSGIPLTQYSLAVDGEEVESGNMPATVIVVGPASGQSTNDNYRLTYVTFGEPGTHTVTLTLTKDGKEETRSLDVEVGNQCSGENENWFAAYVQSNFNECRNCHTQAPDNSSFATLKAWDKIQNSSSLYYVAHAPANFDAMPKANGGNYNHSAGLKWGVDSATHHRVMEMLYRMDTDFTCP